MCGCADIRIILLLRKFPAFCPGSFAIVNNNQRYETGKYSNSNQM